MTSITSSKPRSQLTSQLPVTILLAVLVTAGTILAYLPATRAAFFFDDASNIIEVPAIHMRSFDLDSVMEIARNAALPTRFVANLTLGLDHLRAGLEPRTYHWTNIIIHLCVGFVLALLAATYAGHVNRGSNGIERTSVAVVATSLFMLHPLNTQAVTYVIQRMTSLATLFTLLSFLLYLRGRRPSLDPKHRLTLFTLAGLIWLLALFSKENAVVLPVVIAVFEWSFHRDVWSRRAGELRGVATRHPAAAAISLLSLVFVGMLLAAIAGGNPFSLTEPMHSRDFNGFERVLTQGRVHLLYISLLLWPVPSRLTLDHEFQVSRSLLDPATTVAAILFWLLVFVISVVLAKRKPAYGFPLLAYFVFHSLESGPVNLELVFEHRMYLPLTMLVLLVTVGILDLAPSYRLPVCLIVLLAVASLGIATHQRNVTWSNRIDFLRDAAMKAPSKWRPWINLGTALGRAGEFREARTALEHALSVNPDKSETYNQLGNVALAEGDLDKARALFETALRISPDNVEALNNLGLVYDRSGKALEAIAAYEKFIEGAAGRPDLARQVAIVQRRVHQLRALHTR